MQVLISRPSWHKESTRDHGGLFRLMSISSVMSVSPGTDVQKQLPLSPRVNARARRGAIHLRTDRFDIMTRILGCDTDEARARLIGVTARTLYRARRGNLGHDLIAQTLITLRDKQEELANYNLHPSFDDLFTVVEIEPT